MTVGTGRRVSPRRAQRIALDRVVRSTRKSALLLSMHSPRRPGRSAVAVMSAGLAVFALVFGLRSCESGSDQTPGVALHDQPPRARHEVTH